jgi:hypothetical protein
LIRRSAPCVTGHGLSVACHGLALGFTNPLFIDVDGNGKFDPPGFEHGTLPAAPAGSGPQHGRGARPGRKRGR